MPTRRSTFQGRTCATTDGTKSRDTATRGEQQDHTRGQPRKNRERTRTEDRTELGETTTPRGTFHAPTCVRSPVPAAGKGPSGGPKTDATGERYVAYSRSEASKLALLGYTPTAFARGINTHTHTHTIRVIGLLWAF